MINDRITILINKLKGLQLEQKVVIEEIEELYSELAQQQQHQLQSRIEPATRVSPQVIPEATGPVRQVNRITGEVIVIEGFQVGDRVRITNKVKRTHGNRPINEGDKKATVYDIDLHSGRIHILTDNGTKTWRLTKNLKHI